LHIPGKIRAVGFTGRNLELFLAILPPGTNRAHGFGIYAHYKSLFLVLAIKNPPLFPRGGVLKGGKH